MAMAVAIASATCLKSFCLRVTPTNATSKATGQRGHRLPTRKRSTLAATGLGASTSSRCLLSLCSIASAPINMFSRAFKGENTSKKHQKTPCVEHRRWAHPTTSLRFYTRKAENFSSSFMELFDAFNKTLEPIQTGKKLENIEKPFKAFKSCVLNLLSPLTHLS